MGSLNLQKNTSKSDAFDLGSSKPIILLSSGTLKLTPNLCMAAAQLPRILIINQHIPLLFKYE